jgi:hypothetical protein
MNYTANAVTATVETSGSSGGTPTTTTLSSSSSSLVTNQSVALTATVAASSGTPSGSVGFERNGSAIAGCASQPVALSGSSYIASCQTAFAAASSPEPLTAVFSPAGGSGLQGSTSPTDNLTVGQDSSTTALGVSSSTPIVGASVTYTAIVAPGHAGPTEPSGSVKFLDGGTAIGSCTSQPLSGGASSSTATCALTYAATGSHSITAQYQADANFTGSTSSPAQTVSVQPPPPAKPSEQSLPVITGAAAVGQSLSASTGTWSGTVPISFAEQWRRCASSCVNIQGAKGSTYTLAAADAGARVQVVVTASNSVGSAQAASSEVGPIAPSAAQIKASVARQITPYGKTARIAALLKNHGYVLSFKALSAGKVVIDWYHLPNGAHLASAKPKPLLVAVGKATFARARTVKITIRLTANGKRLLKHANTLKLTARGTFTPTAKHAVIVTQKFTLAR